MGYTEKFPAGSTVQVASATVLKQSMRPDYKFHHPILPEQLGLAGTVAQVSSVGYYFGGDVVYVLSISPGYVWLEECLVECE